MLNNVLGILIALFIWELLKRKGILTNIISNIDPVKLGGVQIETQTD